MLTVVAGAQPQLRVVSGHHRTPLAGALCPVETFQLPNSPAWSLHRFVRVGGEVVPSVRNPVLGLQSHVAQAGKGTAARHVDHMVCVHVDRPPKLTVGKRFWCAVG